MRAFSPIIILWYVFPIIVLFASNFLVTTFHLKQRFKIKVPDITVPFLFVGIHEISKYMNPTSYLPYVLLTILILGMIVVIYQARRHREIFYRRFIKVFWRMAFLISSLAYLLLIVASIVRLFS